MNYPKINTLWKREIGGKKKGTIMEGHYSEEEFISISRWLVTEKIDGMNTRIIYKDDAVTFGGRTDNAQIPLRLLLVLQKHFTVEKFKEIFPYPSKQITIFGEGFGVGIQEPHGRRYDPDKNRIAIFDIAIESDNGLIWLEMDSIKDISYKFGVIPVPVIGIEGVSFTLGRAKSKELSMMSVTEQIVEGYVCTAYPMMCYRKTHTPIRYKIKVSDYEQLNKKSD